MSSVFHSGVAKKTSLKKKLRIDLGHTFNTVCPERDQPTEDCITASYHMYRDLVEMAHEGITVVDPEDNLTYVNKQFAKSLGYKTDELLGKNLSVIATKNTAVKMRKETEKRKKGLKSRYEVTLLNRDGNPKYYWLSVSPMFDSSHRFLGSMGVYSDVTEKKAMEIKLNKKVRQIDTLYRVYGQAKMTKSINSVFAGVAQELVQAFPYKDYVHSKLILDGKAHYYPQKIERYYYKIEIPLIVSGVNRGSLQVGYSTNKLTVKQKHFLREEHKLTKNIADILCKHMQARGILDRYHEIIKRSFTAIIVVSGDRILYANPRFYRMFKCHEKQVVGKSVFLFLPTYNLQRSKKGRINEYKGRRFDGQNIDLSMIYQRINYHGKTAILIRINDISALKKAQIKLSGFNQELKKQVKEKTLHLEEANKRLRSLNQMKDEFIAVTSHELRSPLTSIRGYLSFLAEDESISQLDEPYREYLIRAYSTTDSLNYLINNILDVSRLDMGRFELQKQDTDVIRLTCNILDSLSFQIGERQLVLEFENFTGHDQFILSIDSIRISQVLRNILDNSIKFTKRGKKIRVVLKKTNHDLLMIVSDQGVGIPKTKLEHIFEKFTQIKTTQTKYKGGVGLGLFIAKRIVELHEGTIKASKNHDGGTTVSIHLPLQG